MSRALLFSQVGDQFCDFFHSLFIKCGATQRSLAFDAYVLANSFRRKEKRQRRISLEFFFEKSNGLKFGFVHRQFPRGQGKST